MQNEQINVGDLICMKKKHPCGSFEWRVVRTGADIKIRCMGCDRLVMLDRSEFLKRVTKWVSYGNK